MDYRKVAQQIYDQVGKKENLISVRRIARQGCVL